MSLVLYIGDPHGRPEDLPDCEQLIRLVLEVLGQYKVDRIVFLGDMHHTHAIMHVEVLGFWRRTFKEIHETCGKDIIVLLGNHDQPGDASSKAHALLAYADMPGVRIVDVPQVIDGILHMPYRHDAAQFARECYLHPDVDTVVCHQTFDGAKYENGFYAKDGVQPDAIPQKHVISGHIHDPQVLGKVEYLGSPRWLTVSDANGDRFITLVKHGLDGYVVEKRIPTETHLRKIFHLTDSPDAPITQAFDPRHRYYIDVVGPAEFIESRRTTFSSQARVRTQRTDQAVARVRESEGVDKALRRYLVTYQPSRGTPREVLERFVDARLPVAQIR